MWRDIAPFPVVMVGPPWSAAVRYWLAALALLSAPAFAQYGQLTLSPATVSVDNGQQSNAIASNIVLVYVP